MSARSLVILAGGLAVVLVGARVYLSPDAPPGGGGSGDALVAVIVPALTGAAAAGEKAFDENCASCHGTNAAGRDGIAPPLVHRIYEPGHHADGAFYLAVAKGVRQHHWPFGNMPPVADVSSEEVTDIVAYVRALQRANGIK